MIFYMEIENLKASAHLASLKLLKGQHRGADVATFDVIKQRCTTRLRVLMGESGSEGYKEKILLCQYQELHDHMKRQQQAIERSTRQVDATGAVKNPYKREFGNTIVNPHNFNYVHEPRPCNSNHNLLVSIHSATQVSLSNRI